MGIGNHALSDMQVGGVGMFRGSVLMFAILCAAPGFLFGGTPVTVGHKAPEFTLQAQDGSKVSLRDFNGRWIVLYFYPFPYGCTLEADRFELDQPKYRKRNAVVLGVSVGEVQSPKRCNKEGPNFKLLNDQEGTVSREYGALTNLEVLQLASRYTFIIDPAGRIASIFTHVDVANHSREVLKTLSALQRARGKPREEGP